MAAGSTGGYCDDVTGDNRLSRRPGSLSRHRAGMPELRPRTRLIWSHSCGPRQPTAMVGDASTTPPAPLLTWERDGRHNRRRTADVALMGQDLVGIRPKPDHARRSRRSWCKTRRIVPKYHHAVLMLLARSHPRTGRGRAFVHEFTEVTVIATYVRGDASKPLLPPKTPTNYPGK